MTECTSDEQQPHCVVTKPGEPEWSGGSLMVDADEDDYETEDGFQIVNDSTAFSAVSQYVADTIVRDPAAVLEVARCATPEEFHSAIAGMMARVPRDVSRGERIATATLAASSLVMTLLRLVPSMNGLTKLSILTWCLRTAWKARGR